MKKSTSIQVKLGPRAQVKLPSRANHQAEVKLVPGEKCRPEVKLPMRRHKLNFPRPGIPLRQVKLAPDMGPITHAGNNRGLKTQNRGQVLDPAAEDWKFLQTFVGVKFNEEEKKRLWLAVRSDFVDMFGIRLKKRPNLSTYLKQALWEKLERDGYR